MENVRLDVGGEIVSRDRVSFFLVPRREHPLFPSWGTASASRPSSPSPLSRLLVLWGLASSLPARQEALHRRDDPIGLRHAKLLELRVVGHRDVERRPPRKDGGVELGRTPGAARVGSPPPRHRRGHPSCTTTQRCVFQDRVHDRVLTSRRMTEGGRRSTTSAWTPSFSERGGGLERDVCVIRGTPRSSPSVPSRETCACPSGIASSRGVLAFDRSRASPTP